MNVIIIIIIMIVVMIVIDRTVIDTIIIVIIMVHWPIQNVGDDWILLRQRLRHLWNRSESSDDLHDFGTAGVRHVDVRRQREPRLKRDEAKKLVDAFDVSGETSENGHSVVRDAVGRQTDV